ncbi:MAG: TonB-dependent receptor [Rhodocyclales bacterium]|nr:TonB-dependent receptor [Rhodocyclales bacterium]
MAYLFRSDKKNTTFVFKPNHNVIHLLASLSLLGTCMTAMAEDESAFLEDSPVVLSASRLSQPLRDAPGAVTVLDREQIRASGLRDISDLLRLVPGFVATIAYGSYPVAGYHGLTRDRSSRMLVLIDGRSAYSPYFLGGVEWNNLGVDIDDIERIEVVRGSNSAAYGANAFLGVVNITTRKAMDSERVSLSAQQGEGGINDISVAGSVKSGDLGVRIRARQQRDSGFADYYDGRNLELLDLRGDYQINNQLALEMHAGTNKSGVARGTYGDAGDPPRWTTTQQSYALARLRKSETDGNDWTLSYYHQHEFAKDAFTQTTAIPLPLQIAFGLPASIDITADSAYRTDRDDIEFQRFQSVSQTTRAVWGLGWRRDSMYSPLHFYGVETINTQSTRLFGNLEWRPASSWLFNAGAMIEKASLSGTKTAPRLAVNYHASSQQTLRAAWSRAYRTPTPYEVYSNTKYIYDGKVLRWTDQPAGSLRPERVTAWELGYLAELRSLATTLDVRIFDEKIEDMIQDRKIPLSIPADQLSPVRPESRTSVNGDRARTNGIEYQLMWRPSRRNWLSIAQTFMNIRSSEVGTQFEVRNQRSAPHVVTVISGARELGYGFNLSAAHYRYGRMNWEQTEQENLPPYHRTDLRLGYEFRTGGGKAEVFLVAQHLGQVNNEFKQRYETDRRIFGGFRWEY